jgi:hypothetical protein
MKELSLIWFSLLLASNALADVQMLILDGNGRASTFSSNGQKTRVDDQKAPGFIIIDYASNEIFMVDPKRNEIMKASLKQVASRDSGTAVSINLKDQGGGKKIAGYDTRKFKMIVGGKGCGTVYASQKLLKNSDVRAIFESMRNLQQFSRGMMSGMSGMLTVCQRAGMQLADVIESSGAPLQVVDENGKLISDVTSVDTDKTFASNHYDLPAGMNVVDMSEKVNQAAQQTQQLMESMPDMDELMDQIQQGGGEMTEETQQQLQEMMKQLQQQQQ